MTEYSTVGALLRARRLELGISLEEVAGRTRVRRTYLTALENDRFDVIPGEAYVAGFLRIYAEDLGLPVDQVLARCREQMTTAGDVGREKTAPGARSLPRGSRRRSGWGVIFTAAALVGAALVLAHLNAGEAKKANFFASRSGPVAFPAVLWAVLMPENAGEAPFLPLLSTAAGEAPPSAAGAAPPAASPPVPPRPPCRPRLAESRPVGIFLGWSAERPDPPPLTGAGPDMLVLYREGAPNGQGQR